MVEVVPGRVVGGIAEAEVRPEVDDRLAALEELVDPAGDGAVGEREEHGLGVVGDRVEHLQVASSRGAGGCPRSGRPAARGRRGRRSATFGWRASSRMSSAPTYPVAPTIATRTGSPPRARAPRWRPRSVAAGVVVTHGPPRSPRPSSPRSPARGAARGRQARGAGDRAERGHRMTIHRTAYSCKDGNGADRVRPAPRRGHSGRGRRTRRRSSCRRARRSGTHGGSRPSPRPASRTPGST